MYGIPITFKTSDVKATSGASAQFDTTMISGVQYVLRATADIWYRADSANPTAAANTDQNHFLAKGQTALIAGGTFKVAVIQDTAAGYAILSEIGPKT